MKNSEFRALYEPWIVARKLHNNHVHNNKPSRRSAKGKAKGFGLPMKNSRVFSISTEKLSWSPHKYKSLNATFNGITQAS